MAELSTNRTGPARSSTSLICSPTSWPPQTRDSTACSSSRTPRRIRHELRTVCNRVHAHLLELQAERALASIEGSPRTPPMWLISTGRSRLRPAPTSRPPSPRSRRCAPSSSDRRLAEEMATMALFATTYVGEPDIPAGLTISEYRRSRPRRLTWWRPAVAGDVPARPHRSDTPTPEPAGRRRHRLRLCRA